MGTNRKFLQDYVAMADHQAQRLEEAFHLAKPLFPLTADALETIQADRLASLDMLTTRFGKLQDVIGSKIFPLLLEALSEDAASFRDKLNRLEKLHYLDDVYWWLDLRQLRNQLAHDYPDDDVTIACTLNALETRVQELLAYWNVLKNKIGQLDLNPPDGNLTGQFIV